MNTTPPAPEPKFLIITLKHPFTNDDWNDFRTVVNNIEHAGVEYLFTATCEKQETAYFKHATTTNETLNKLVNDDSDETVKILMKHLLKNKLSWGLAYQ